ncbi:hypothetical protein J2S74_002181 [Evansella vedderi]|uniref:Uncharacterized protein n=1 Tax=Evansella vedderi TaxID=38282 RepID=A0ABT9ZVN4_9BACI|nr:hypothetical protein [Evansella vedderi]MDQ0254802.1 hypothetical protein [Evansella vedderi]
MDDTIRDTIRQALLANVFNLTPPGHLVTIVDEDGRARTIRADEAVLRPGEIGVVFCLPIFGAPSRRLPDVNLRRDQFVRVRCGLTTIDVFCDRRVTGPPTQTVTLRTGEFFVVTCER